MEFSEENYSLEEDDNFQPTLLETNADSIKEVPIKANYKKWINSESDISHISNIIKLEIDTSNDKYSSNNEINQKEIINKETPKEEINNDNNKPNEKKEETNNNINNKYTFIYPDKAQNVKLTGSFCNWNIKYDMIKDPNDNKFKLALPLNNEIYQFKFIVDNEWKYSSNYQTQPDNLGNINNCIDLTNYFKKEETIKKNSKDKLPLIGNENTPKTKETTSSDKEENKIIKRKESIYDCEYPSDDNIIPMPLPNKRYYKSFKLDKYSHQNSIGNQKYLNYDDKISLSYEASSKPIFLLGHVNLNHLICFKNKKMITAKNCMSFRYREKACTILYYK
jgi:hypothetical protein